METHNSNSDLGKPDSHSEHPETVVLDGESLTCEDLVRIGMNKVKVDISQEAWERIRDGRQVVDDILATGKVVYGINTGFGNFASVTISPEDVGQLQTNLIRSHAAGVGPALPVHRARMLLGLRINVLCKGYSGARAQTVESLLKALNANCIPLVPERGTVGASGDLAPLSHIALGMMGEGKMWHPTKETWCDAKDVLADQGLTPITLHAKEGLALINGTQFITSLGAEAIYRAEQLAKQADVVAAVTLESLQGSMKCFDARIHNARPHKGQGLVAKRMRSLLLEQIPGESFNKPSEINLSHQNCTKVQDAYTLRCTPQVHGVVHDTIEFVKRVVETELNSATDNPMVFSANSPNNDSQLPGFKDVTVSGGNFHGEYPAKMMDYLCIGIQEIANISERRIERLVNTSLSGLPPFLVKQGGLNSGFMIAHCTAAALTSENKVLVHPSSSDTLSTSAGKEDHVSMGGFAARKVLQVVENVERVVGIELLAACQAMDFVRPLRSTTAIERVYELVRSLVPFYDVDRYMAPELELSFQLIHEGRVWQTVKDLIHAE